METDTTGTCIQMSVAFPTYMCNPALEMLLKMFGVINNTDKNLQAIINRMEAQAVMPGRREELLISAPSFAYRTSEGMRQLLFASAHPFPTW